jgi:hypothetical protein
MAASPLSRPETAIHHTLRKVISQERRYAAEFCGCAQHNGHYSIAGIHGG